MIIDIWLKLRQITLLDKPEKMRDSIWLCHGKVVMKTKAKHILLSCNHLGDKEERHGGLKRAMRKLPRYSMVMHMCKTHTMRHLELDITKLNLKYQNDWRSLEIIAADFDIIIYVCWNNRRKFAVISWHLCFLSRVRFLCKPVNWFYKYATVTYAHRIMLVHWVYFYRLCGIWGHYLGN